MRSALTIAAAAEAGTGLVLLVLPELVVRLLFGSAVEGAGAVLSRFAGIALLGLGSACWPRGGDIEGARRGILLYGALSALYLGYLGVSGGPAGPLLWPAVAVHVALCLLLARRPTEHRRVAA